MSHGFRSYVNRVGYSTVSLPPAPQCAASVSSGSSSSSSESWQLSTVNGLVLLAFITHRIHGAAIYGNIYHQYTPNVSIYTSTMDPMGYGWPSPSQISQTCCSRSLRSSASCTSLRCNSSFGHRIHRPIARSQDLGPWGLKSPGLSRFITVYHIIDAHKQS